MNSDELTDEEIVDLYLASIYHKVSSGEMTIGQVKGLNKTVETISRTAYRERSDYKPKEYVSREFTDDCYRTILEGCEDYRSVLLSVSKKHDKSEEWLKGVRHERIFHAKDVVDSYDDHPKQVDMSHRKVINKNHLKSSNSVVQLVKTLEGYRNIYDYLVSMEERLAALESDNETIKVDVNNLKRDSKIEKAKKMDNVGMDKKMIAEKLGVSVKTIRRWLKP